MESHSLNIFWFNLDIFHIFAENHLNSLYNSNVFRRRFPTSGNIDIPLGLSGIGLIEDTVNINNVETSGGTAIVNATSWSFSNGLEVSALPSLRMILDFADLDNSLSIHTTGQSGHPMSDHYNDMVEQWRMIEYNPMLFSEKDVESNASSTLILQPSN